MSLTRHVDPDDVVRRVHPFRSPSKGRYPRGKSGEHLGPYSSDYTSQQEIPKFKIPQDGAPADTVYQMLKDELDLDGRTNLNLAR
jgi:glutamate decarboxylase